MGLREAGAGRWGGGGEMITLIIYTYIWGVVVGAGRGQLITKQEGKEMLQQCTLVFILMYEPSGILRFSTVL